MDGPMEASPKRVEMIPARRRALILERVRQNGAASIGELADEIGASQSTVRRDLEQLTEGGYLERTHGGALLVPPLGATFEREPGSQRPPATRPEARHRGRRGPAAEPAARASSSTVPRP